MPASYWAYDYIQGLAKLNVVSGFPDGKFHPEEPVTRAQFAAVLRQAFLPSQSPSAQSFSDVRANYWAADAISAARYSGFLAGYPNNRFRPDAPVRRADALVALASGLRFSNGPSEILNRYRDTSEIPKYAYAALQSAAQADIIVPDNKDATKLSPLKSATRADVAAFVYKALASTTEWPNKPVAVIPAAAISASFSNTGERLATLTREGEKVQVWNAQTTELLSEIVATGENRFLAIALSGDGTKIGVIAQNKTTETLELGLWNTQTKVRLWQQPLNKASEYELLIAFRPDDQMLLVKAVFDEASPVNQIRLYDTTTGAIAQSLTSAYSQIAFRQDGEILAGYNLDGVDIWQLSDSRLIGSFDPGQALPPSCDGQCSYFPTSIAFAPDGNLKVLSQNMFEGILNTWNVQQKTLADTSVPIETDRGDRFEIISPDGKYVFLGGPVAGFRLVNSQTGYSGWKPDFGTQDASETITDRIPADSYSVTPVFSPNGDYFATVGVEANANVYIFAKGKP